jgi:hypothetical protein
MRRTVLAGALALLPMAAACGQAGEDSASDSGAAGQPGELIARAAVLESHEHGAQLCLSGMLESLPPQCGGPDLIGWDWDAVTGYRERGGTRWGVFVVIGTYDQADATFTLTRAAAPAAEYDGTGLPAKRGHQPAWHTPCPEPEGGWRVVDPALTTDRSLLQTVRAARARPDVGGLWVDQSINPAVHDPVMAHRERLLNDPARLILNVAVTGDVGQAEADLRQTWGGALCISRVGHTARELRRVQRHMSSLPGFLASDVAKDRVHVSVIWDDGSLQDTLDERYGAGVVAVTTALHRFRP